MWMELKKGEANPMLEAAREISIFGPRALTPEEAALAEQRGERVADSWEEDPRNPRNQKEDRTALMELEDGTFAPRWLIEGDDVAGDNAKGSFEALLQGWGQSSHGQALDTSALTR